MPDLFFVVIQVIEHRIFVVDLEDNRSWPAQSCRNQAKLFVGVRFDSESRSVEAFGTTAANLLLDPNLPTQVRHVPPRPHTVSANNHHTIGEMINARAPERIATNARPSNVR